MYYAPKSALNGLDKSLEKAEKRHKKKYFIDLELQVELVRNHHKL